MPREHHSRPLGCFDVVPNLTPPIQGGINLLSILANLVRVQARLMKTEPLSLQAMEGCDVNWDELGPGHAWTTAHLGPNPNMAKLPPGPPGKCDKCGWDGETPFFDPELGLWRHLGFSNCLQCLGSIICLVD